MGATKAKRVGPSLLWMFVPYQKCCIEVEHTVRTISNPCKPLQHLQSVHMSAGGKACVLFG